MIRLCLSAVVLGLMLTTRVLAAPSSYVVWTTENVRLIRDGDPVIGKQLAYGCVGCHGTEGLSVSPAYPHIAGQDVFYLFKQLQDFKESAISDSDKTGLPPHLVCQ
jgi:cytochrome c553